MDRVWMELGFPDRRKNFLRRREDDIIVGPKRELSLCDLVLYLVRNCRRAGFGLSRSKTISYGEMTASLAKLLDDMACETGVVMREDDRKQLVEELPHYAYHVDILYPQESLSGACWAATRALQSLFERFKETGDVAILKKVEGLLDFLSELEIDVAFFDEIARFKQQFADAQKSNEAQKGVLDHWLDKAILWRQTQRARR